MSDQVAAITGTSPEFDALPLQEVCIKRVPVGAIPTELDLILQIHEAVKGQFPTLKDLDQLDIPPSTGLSLPQVFTTFGARFINPETGVEVSLHPGLFTAKWRKASGQQYPRYEELSRALDLVIEAYKTVTGHNFAYLVVNITYSNHILPQGDGSHPDPWPFSDGWFPTAAREELSPMSYEIVVRDSMDRDHRASLTRVAAPSGDGFVYQLDTVIGSNIRGAQRVKDVERNIHEKCCEWFIELLSHEAKKAFGLRNR